jgi:hypothetical protein
MLSQTTLDSFERPSRTFITQSLHMCTTPKPYEFIYYEAESQCRLGPHTYMTPWYDDICSLYRSTPFAAIATYLTETGTLVVKKVLNLSTLHQAQPKHHEDVDTNATGPLSPPPHIPHPRTKSVPDHESYPSQPTVPLHRTRETSWTTLSRST